MFYFLSLFPNNHYFQWDNFINSPTDFNELQNDPLPWTDLKLPLPNEIVRSLSTEYSNSRHYRSRSNSSPELSSSPIENVSGFNYLNQNQFNSDAFQFPSIDSQINIGHERSQSLPCFSQNDLLLFDESIEFSNVSNSSSYQNHSITSNHYRSTSMIDLPADQTITAQPTGSVTNLIPASNRPKRSPGFPSNRPKTVRMCDQI